MKGYHPYGAGYGAGKNRGADRGTLALYTPPMDVEDRIPQVANRLYGMKERLTEDARKVYRALQVAMQRHSVPCGSRPNFEKDFVDNLFREFPNAYNIVPDKRGSLNQWSVKIDDSPPIYCSVRLEVFGDNNTFVKSLKTRARAVTDTLLSEDAKWKKVLLPEHGPFNEDKLHQFERECNVRARNMDYMKGGGKGNRENNGWIDRSRALCERCNRPEDEDQLNGVHMCVVVATFVCPECRYSWTSYHGRLTPDSEMMGQACRQCKGGGEAKDWRPLTEGEKDGSGGQEREWGEKQGGGSSSGGRLRGSGMHQSELCTACREYGNCMGVFYDPFVLTTALSMVTDKRVLWRIFSKDLPELLIADLGSSYSNMQVCLQPHVYVPHIAEIGWRGGGGPQKMHYDRDDEHGQYRGGRSQREQPALSNEAHSDWHGAVSSTASAPPRGGNAYAGSLPPQVGGVKDQDGFNRYLASQEKGGNRGGYSHHDAMEPPLPEGPRAAGAEAHFNLVPDMPPRHEQAPAQQYGDDGGNAGADHMSMSQQYLEPRPVSAMQSDEAKGPMSAEGGNPTPPAPGALPKANKFNKIGARGGGGPPNQAPSSPGSTPLLERLLPIQRAHLVNCVRKELKATAGADAERFKKAEEYLARCGGDYEMAYSYVRGLTENAGIP